MPCSPSLRALALCCALLGSTALAQNPAPITAPAAAAGPAAPAGQPEAAPQPAPEQSAAPVVGDRNGALSDRIPPEQVLWLEAGTDRFMARYQPDLSGLPLGAALVLHDSGQHPSWPATVAALVDELPLHGWTVLAIELPAPALDRSAALAPVPAAPLPAKQPAPTSPAEPVPAAAGTAPATVNPATAEPPAPAAATPELLEGQAQARIQAALDHLIAQRQTMVAVIGFGSGALRGAEFVRKRAAGNGAGVTRPVAGLALVAPLERLPGLTDPLPVLLPATALPALDLALRNDARTRAEADARRRAVLHQRERDYLQLELPPVNPTLSATHSAIVKRLRGWLQQHVAVTAEAEPARPAGAAPAPGQPGR